MLSQAPCLRVPFCGLSVQKVLQNFARVPLHSAPSIALSPAIDKQNFPWFLQCSVLCIQGATTSHHSRDQKYLLDMATDKGYRQGLSLREKGFLVQDRRMWAGAELLPVV